MSLIFMENSPSYVLVISLGPVQEFIATARRCRDLWFGSWLLSELSKAAALAIHQAISYDSPAQTLIFPPPDTPFNDDTKSVSNKLLAVVSDPKTVVVAAKKAADARLGFLANETFKRFESKINGEAALAQVLDLLEWSWGAALIENDNFAAARLQAEKAVAARKGCRDFAAVGNWAGSAYKSSFDGARESVILNQPKTEEEGFKTFGSRKGEFLCGVALLKRQGQKGKMSIGVASTSHIAAQGLLHRWKQKYPDAPQAQRDLVTSFVGTISASSVGLCGVHRVRDRARCSARGQFD